MTAWPCGCLACCHSLVANPLPQESGNWFPGPPVGMLLPSSCMAQMHEYPQHERFQQVHRSAWLFLYELWPATLWSFRWNGFISCCTVRAEYWRSTQQMLAYVNLCMHSFWHINWYWKVFSCVMFFCLCVCVCVCVCICGLCQNHWLLSEASLKNLWDVAPLCLCVHILMCVCVCVCVCILQRVSVHVNLYFSCFLPEAPALTVMWLVAYYLLTESALKLPILFA